MSTPPPALASHVTATYELCFKQLFHYLGASFCMEIRKHFLPVLI